MQRVEGAVSWEEVNKDNGEKERREGERARRNSGPKSLSLCLPPDSHHYLNHGSEEPLRHSPAARRVESPTVKVEGRGGETFRRRVSGKKMCSGGSGGARRRNMTGVNSSKRRHQKNGRRSEVRLKRSKIK